MEKDVFIVKKAKVRVFIPRLFDIYSIIGLNILLETFCIFLNHAAISVIYTEFFTFEMRSETLKFVHAQNYTIPYVVSGADRVKYTIHQRKC